MPLGLIPSVLKLPNDPSARDVIEAVGRRLPEISRLLPSCRLAVDCSYVADDAQVSAGSEIALILPVSGG